MHPHVLVNVTFRGGELQPGKDGRIFPVASRVADPPFRGAFIGGVDDELLASNVVGGGRLDALNVGACRVPEPS